MRQASVLFPVAAIALSITAPTLAKAAQESEIVTPQQVTKPNPPPPEEGEDYRPPWADPNAKASEPGIDDDPTPFNPADVDNKSVLDND